MTEDFVDSSDTSPPDLCGENFNPTVLRALGGYGRLWLAVIEDALRSARRGDPDSLDWLFCDDDDLPGSFRWVCESLGLDASYARRCVRKGLGLAKMTAELGA